MRAVFYSKSQFRSDFFRVCGCPVLNLEAKIFDAIVLFSYFFTTPDRFLVEENLEIVN
jgi:hypothetical protein